MSETDDIHSTFERAPLGIEPNQDDERYGHNVSAYSGRVLHWWVQRSSELYLDVRWP